MRRYAWRSSLLLLIDMIVWDRSEFFVLTRFSTLRDVAFYSLSFNVVQQALILPRMFAQGFSANLLVERGRDPESVVRLSRDGMRYVFLIAAPLTLGLAALDRAIMPLLYGPEYTEAIPVIAIVAGLAVLRGALVPVQDLLRMTEQQSFLIGFSMFMGIVNIALDLWLIPSGGAVGAAWANGIAQALAMAGLTAFACDGSACRVPLGDMGRILLACLPMVVVVRARRVLHHWPAVLLGVPLGAAVYMTGAQGPPVLRPVDLGRLASLDAHAAAGRCAPPINAGCGGWWCREPPHEAAAQRAAVAPGLSRRRAARGASPRRRRRHARRDVLHRRPLRARSPRRRPADQARSRVRWVDEYPRVAEGLRDADGRPPRYSFFFPGGIYDPELVSPLAALCHDGLGEFDVHLHHSTTPQTTSARR